MFKLCVMIGLLTVALAAPAPKPQPKPKPTLYATTYSVPSVVAAPVVAYTADLEAPVVYADEYYDPAALYTAYAAPIVVF
ncbi:hypothetical protein MTP99_014192 [Tenebrio molitor]|nr:hypothetical protein MTP99_014192 [Tenebrio molitor]